MLPRSRRAVSCRRERVPQLLAGPLGVFQGWLIVQRHVSARDRARGRGAQREAVRKVGIGGKGIVRGRLGHLRFGKELVVRPAHVPSSGSRAQAEVPPWPVKARNSTGLSQRLRSSCCCSSSSLLFQAQRMAIMQQLSNCLWPRRHAWVTNDQGKPIIGQAWQRGEGWVPRVQAGSETTRPTRD